ncbi:hypothetical protein COT47_02540 [Candidatus Woesearchaeota archaeon CG08_land_8_20_14_0_20_43_7]|nr:MAG: hypothetical protein COT47_02540 [Candidatus Woesearchaeota archaeon CG08_land_8_20_14_0_20_43_7]
MSDLKEISIEVTNRCSLRCIHCSSDSGNQMADELSLEEITGLIDQAKELGASILTLSGGDPLLRDDLPDIIGYGREQRFQIRLQTAGVYDFGLGLVSIPDEFLSGFRNDSNCMDRITYSVHGTKETHDKMTAIEGSFDLVMESIKKAKKAGIFVEVHTVPSRLNLTEMQSIAEILASENVDRMHILRLVTQGRCSQELGLDLDEFKELQMSLTKLVADGLEVELGHNIDRRYWSDLTKGPVRCRIGEGKMLIRPNGDLTYCAALKTDSVGNIKDRTLRYFWKEHPFIMEVRRFFREDYLKIKGKCNDCDILEKCFGGCIAQRLYHHKDLLKGPDPICYRKKR